MSADADVSRAMLELAKLSTLTGLERKLPIVIVLLRKGKAKTGNEKDGWIGGVMNELAMGEDDGCDSQLSSWTDVVGWRMTGL